MQNIKLLIADIEFGLRHRDYLLKNITITQKEKMLKFAKETDQIRSLLSSYMKNQLSKEEEKTNDLGKPYFPNGPYFNISHGGQYLVMAISNNEIGIDIEESKERDISSFKKIFNETEVKLLKSPADFYFLWCAKESLIKCMGGSINKIKEVPSLPLNGLKTYKGIDYQCRSFVYEKHIISITVKGFLPFEITTEKVEKFPFIIIFN